MRRCAETPIQPIPGSRPPLRPRRTTLRCAARSKGNEEYRDYAAAVVKHGGRGKAVVAADVLGVQSDTDVVACVREVTSSRFALPCHRQVYHEDANTALSIAHYRRIKEWGIGLSSRRMMLMGVGVSEGVLFGGGDGGRQS